MQTFQGYGWGDGQKVQGTVRWDRGTVQWYGTKVPIFEGTVVRCSRTSAPYPKKLNKNTTNFWAYSGTVQVYLCTAPKKHNKNTTNFLQTFLFLITRWKTGCVFVVFFFGCGAEVRLYRTTVPLRRTAAPLYCTIVPLYRTTAPYHCPTSPYPVPCGRPHQRTRYLSVTCTPETMAHMALKYPSLSRKRSSDEGLCVAQLGLLTLSEAPFWRLTQKIQKNSSAMRI